MAISRISCVIGGVALAALLGGCRGGISKDPPVHLVLDMDFQGKLKAQSASTFPGWTDGRGMRLPVEGTVARGSYPDTVEHVMAHYDADRDGKLSRLESKMTRFHTVFALADTDKNGSLDAAEAKKILTVYTYKNADGTPLKNNALPASLEVLNRGHQRFNIHCAVCHGRTGKGGVVATRWPVKVPDLVEDEDADTRNRLNALSHGELVQVMTEGKGTMPAYSSQIRIEDRWAIAHYVKALQNHFNN